MSLDRYVEFECRDCGDVMATQDLSVVEHGLCTICERKPPTKRIDKMESKSIVRATEPLPLQTVTDEAMWKLIAGGDLRGLDDKQKTAYYLQLCNSLGMNPATQPFEYITLNGKLRLYAKKDATDQLRQIKGVSIVGKPEIVDDGEYITASVAVEDKSGRTDGDIGVVFAGGNKGEMRANLRMKALTKAKRRATLSVCGLGMLDESEVEDIPNVRPRGALRDAGYDAPTAPVTMTAPEDESQEPPNTDDDMTEAFPVPPPVVKAFAALGVSKAQLEKVVQRDLDPGVVLPDTERRFLEAIYKRLKAKTVTWPEVEAEVFKQISEKPA